MVNRHLAASFRRRHRAHAEQLRQDGRARRRIPELLDWLALEFVERGWSMKAMHRLMMTSEAYQMASDDIAGQRRDRSREPAVLAHAAAAARGGDHPRPDPGRRRHARPHAGRTERLPVHRSRICSRSSSKRDLARQAGRRSVDLAAQPLCVLEAQHPLSDVRDVRSAEPDQLRATGATARRSRRRRCC